MATLHFRTIYLELTAWTHSPCRQIINLQTPTKISSIPVCLFRLVTRCQNLRFVLRVLVLYKYVYVLCTRWRSRSATAMETSQAPTCLSIVHTCFHSLALTYLQFLNQVCFYFCRVLFHSISRQPTVSHSSICWSLVL